MRGHYVNFTYLAISSEPVDLQGQDQRSRSKVKVKGQGQGQRSRSKAKVKFCLKTTKKPHFEVGSRSRSRSRPKVKVKVKVKFISKSYKSTFFKFRTPLRADLAISQNSNLRSNYDSNFSLTEYTDIALSDLVFLVDASRCIVDLMYLVGNYLVYFNNKHKWTHNT